MCAAPPSAVLAIAPISGPDLQLLAAFDFPGQGQWAPPLPVTYERDGVNVTLQAPLQPRPGYNWWADSPWDYYGSDPPRVALGRVVAGPSVYAPWAAPTCQAVCAILGMHRVGLMHPQPCASVSSTTGAPAVAVPVPVPVRCKASPGPGPG